MFRDCAKLTVAVDGHCKLQAFQRNAVGPDRSCSGDGAQQVSLAVSPSLPRRLQTALASSPGRQGIQSPRPSSPSRPTIWPPRRRVPLKLPRYLPFSKMLIASSRFAILGHPVASRSHSVVLGVETRSRRGLHRLCYAIRRAHWRSTEPGHQWRMPPSASPKLLRTSSLGKKERWRSSIHNYAKL